MLGGAQGACEIRTDNPSGTCTLDMYEDGFRTNPGRGADTGKLFLSNLRIRQSPLQLGRATGGGALLPTTGQAGLILAGNEQLWLKDVFLEGSALSPRARGLDAEAGVAVYMEGVSCAWVLLISAARAPQTLCHSGW